MVVFLLVLVIVILISSNYCLLWRRKWPLTPVFLPGESHGQRSLAGYSPGGCKSRTAAAAVKSLQSCPTLCDPMDGSPPGYPVPGILQARTLEWVAISFSNAWKWKVKVKSLSHVWLLPTPWTAAYKAPLSMGFSRHKDWSGVPLPSVTHYLATIPPLPPPQLTEKLWYIYYKIYTVLGLYVYFHIEALIFNEEQ